MAQHHKNVCRNVQKSIGGTHTPFGASHTQFDNSQSFFKLITKRPISTLKITLNFTTSHITLPQTSYPPNTHHTQNCTSYNAMASGPTFDHPILIFLIKTLILSIKFPASKNHSSSPRLLIITQSNSRIVLVLRHK